MRSLTNLRLLHSLLVVTAMVGLAVVFRPFDDAEGTSEFFLT